MSTQCPVCGRAPLVVADELQMQMCQGCAVETGVRPMPPALRPPAPCTRCKGLEFVRTVPREYAPNTEPKRTHDRQLAAPMFFTHSPTFGMYGGRHDIEIDKGYGQLEMYACLGCGFVEWYVHAPRDIPIHPHLMTDKIDYGAGGPYR